MIAQLLIHNCDWLQPLSIMTILYVSADDLCFFIQFYIRILNHNNKYEKNLTRTKILRWSNSKMFKYWRKQLPFLQTLAYQVQTLCPVYILLNGF